MVISEAESELQLTSSTEISEEEDLVFTEIEPENNELEDNLMGSERIEEIEHILTEILEIKPYELEEQLLFIPEVKLYEASKILEVILQTVKNVENFENIGETDFELVESNMEIMVERLLECLEIKYTPEMIKEFVEVLLNGENVFDIEELLKKQNEGTHERKYLSSWITAILKSKPQAKNKNHDFIGNFILKITKLDLITLQPI